MRIPFALDALRGLWLLGCRLAEQRRRNRYWRRQGVEISDLALFTLCQNGQLEIGAGSRIGAYTMVDLSSDPNGAPGSERSVSRLRIGQHTAINEFNNIRAGGGTIVIGDNCLVAQYVSIIGSNHTIDGPGLMRATPWDLTRSGVTIGDDVWIGAHAVILPGVTIGTGSVVAAGAVVSRDVPEYAVVAGVPAEVKRFRVNAPCGNALSCLAAAADGS